MRKLLFAIVVFLLCLSPAFAAWDNSSFTYRKLLNSVTQDSQNQVSYTMSFYLPNATAGHFNANFSDLAVYCSGVRRPVFLNGTNTTGEINLITQLDTNTSACYLYYGNPADITLETSEGAFNSTMLFGTISEGTTLNTSLWTKKGTPTVTVGGGQTSIIYSADQVLYSNWNFTDNTTLVIEGFKAGAINVESYPVGFSTNGAATYGASWELSTAARFYTWVNGASGQKNEQVGTFGAGATMQLEIRRNGNNLTCDMFWNGTIQKEYSGGFCPTTSLPIWIEATATGQTFNFTRLYVFKSVSPKPTVTFGTEELNVGGSVGIVAPPAGEVSLNNTRAYSFYFNSSAIATTPCYRSLNSGVFVNLGNVTNATLFSSQMLGLTAGAYSMNITCESGASNTSDLRNFTILDFQSIGDSYAATDYEINTSKFAFYINASNRVSSVSANLTWNGTAISGTGSSTGGSYFVETFNVSKTVPLLRANTSVFTWWNYTVTLTNGTVATYGTTPRTITLNQSYLITTINATPSIVTEGDLVVLRSTISHAPITGATISPITFLVGGAAYAGTLESSTSGWDTYFVSLYAPTSSGATPYNATFTLTLGASVLNKTSSTQSYTAYQINFTDCAAPYNVPFLTFVPKDESNLSNTNLSFNPIEFVISIRKTSVYREFNFSFSNSTATICMNPPNATVIANATIKYTATGSNSTFATRYYYLVNAQLSNQTSTVNLYNLNNTLATNFVLNLVDNNRNKVSGAILDVQRYYLSIGNFIAVAMGQTDFASGSTNINLLASENLYAITIFYGGNNVSTLYPVSLTSNPLTLVLSPQDFTSYPNRKGAVVSICSNVTSTLSCTFADSSGLNPRVTLTAYRVFALTNITACTTSVIGNAGTLICSLGNTTNTDFTYYLTADYSDSMHLLLQSGVIYFTGPPQFKGPDGTLLTLALVTVAGGMFLYSPSAGVVMILLALTAARLFWIIDIGLEAMAALYIVGAMLVYRLRY